MRCTQPGCPGRIIDGYCNVCGLPGGTPPATPAAPAGATGDGTPGIVPTLRPSGPCQMPGCRGQIVDGYCDTCGAPAGASVPATTISTTGRIGTIGLGSARAGSAAARVRPADTARPQGHLGAGLTTVPPEPPVNPKSAILKNPEVPEDRRFCPHCGAEVGRSSPDGPGRVEGYCPNCRKAYSFTPKLAPGDLVAGQYEVRGPLAHGGMGWIYLAQDRNVSNRWVVLKGLLNAGDKASVQAAMSEQRFLAELQNPLIVEIYNFVTQDGGAYIVMEFVGGRSLKQILKERVPVNGGTYDPLPMDQALAYILEILPAFSYLHGRGLLYCDFKPDNLMHIEDSVKLIDMGGVRRIDDDDSAIFGTVGFQAPEVPTRGCSVASDIFTIGRTLLVACAEVKGYQTTYATTLPPIEELPQLARYDSAYRLIAKACAPNPSDRFTSAEEMRQQMLGVLREVVNTEAGQAATTSAASGLFESPTVVADVFTWKQLPRLRPDSADPALITVVGLDPALSAKERYQALLNQPARTLEVQIALCLAAIEAGATDTLKRTVNDILVADPWQWRAAWIEGLASLNTGDWAQAQSCFNAVLGQVPGELAPKFALAVACEMGGELDVAEHLYQVCAMTDAAYVAGAGFGLARVRAKRKDASGHLTDLPGVLAALDLVPPTSGGWQQARRLVASYLIYSGHGVPDLAKAAVAIRDSGASTEDRLRLELAMYRQAYTQATAASVKAARGKAIPAIGGVPLTKATVRTKVESILRQQAALEHETATRVRLIDHANSLRKWTVI